MFGNRRRRGGESSLVGCRQQGQRRNKSELWLVDCTAAIAAWEEAEVGLLAGLHRLAVATLDSGSRGLNGQLGKEAVDSSSRTARVAVAAR